MENILKQLTKSVLTPLGITAAASPTNVAIQNKIFGSGMTTSIISCENMNDFMKIIKYLEESGLLIKGVRETIKNEAKEQKGEFLCILLDTLVPSLLQNLLIVKVMKVKIPGERAMRAAEGTIGAGEGKVKAGQKF